MDKIINDIYKNRPYFIKIIHHYTHDYAGCEDIFQDALVKFVKSINNGNYKDEGKPKGYFSFICMNLAKDYLRKEKGKPFMFDYDAIKTHKVSSMSIDYDKNVLINTIGDSLNKTSLRRRVILKLLIEGWKYQEIAEMIGAPVGTIKGSIHKIRLAIKDNLETNSLLHTKYCK